MRGTIGIGRKFPNPTNLFHVTKQTLIPFSTSSSGSGRGRGRGPGFDFNVSQVPGRQTDSEDPKPGLPPGPGRGSGGSRPSFEFTFSQVPGGQPESEEPEPGFYPPPSPAGIGRGSRRRFDSTVSQSPGAPPESKDFKPGSSPNPGLGRGSPRRVDSTVPQALGAPPESKDPTLRRGLGHGSGKSIPSSFSPFVSSKFPSSAGRGQAPGYHESDAQTSEVQDNAPKSPIFFKRDGGQLSESSSQLGDVPEMEREKTLPESIISVLTGAGRGKPMKQPVAEVQTGESNRHVRARKSPVRRAEPGTAAPAGPKMSLEEKKKRAIELLSRGGDGEEGGRGGRGRGGRGRGGRGMWRGRGRGGRGRFQETEDEHQGLYLGDNADGEKLANKVGPEVMSQLAEGFEEMAHRVLPSRLDEAYLDNLDYQCRIEFEPEYLMGELNQNPDIDEKPPIPLRDALEKVKPFLMEYEGIQSQEEWEEAMKETMERVPLLKEIVDYYAGPERVTAKQQQEELERVAKTLPESAPDSVKKFTERAVLSLQSNPGWGFDKKCQFMDRLVMRVAKHYK